MAVIYLALANTGRVGITRPRQIQDLIFGTATTLAATGFAHRRCSPVINDTSAGTHKNMAAVGDFVCVDTFVLEKRTKCTKFAFGFLTLLDHREKEQTSKKKQSTV